MFNTIEEYLDALKLEMKDADPALVQDAQADAQEHLSNALLAAREANAEVSEADALTKIIDEYGSPEETALAYQEVERRTAPLLKGTVKPRSWLARFFGVYADPYAWGAILFMLLSFVTGIIYFVWGVTGLSLSVSLMILIIGIPFAILFLVSVRGMALLEGRLVEALLGIRMPRRAAFSHQGMAWLDRLKALLTDKATWLMLVYMLVQFVLGIAYFVVIVVVLSFALTFIAIPFVQMYVTEGVINWGDNVRYYVPLWSTPLFVLAGLLLWTTFMHLARAVGQLHGRFAKWLLVAE
jgi:hypothetical protein